MDIRRKTTAKKSKEIRTNQKNQRVLMAIRENPEEISRMFTENVCMDFDVLGDYCLGTVVTDALIGNL
jgi:hypothetical protein